MAKPKKKPAAEWRLYLVVAVDPYWDGKQYRGRFYKYGITTKANILDRHPSYTEVLLDLPLGGDMARYMEVAIGENLRQFRTGAEFSVEAVSCERIGADAMKVLVEAVYRGTRIDWTRIDCSSRKIAEHTAIGGYEPLGARFDASLLLAFLSWSDDGLIAEDPIPFEQLNKVTFGDEALFYRRERVIRFRWRERFVAAYNSWRLATKAVSRVPEPMWA